MKSISQAAVVLAVLVGAVVPAPASAVPVFSCEYEFVAWSGAFSAELSITNNGPAIDSWQASWTFPTATAKSAVWRANLSQRTPYDMTASNLAWNGRIATGQVRTFGWTAFAVATETPGDITVNGVPC
ncbi:hypothetical protein Aple_057610 [Acrocarpospora pleiomorpha]|uniref:CBM2 domain-containing protein n=1 Tax=Acrocarpospora pleiomorpha TaxID=90975 RepID=A0A5M3XPF5_9ACTN|nr:cellulose binding domain-containing protein [Acrocarpospora pleiomorpha]GES22862.1 hypothetical protein Aple_057610 [Acrocarpospora pleiomorpha]